MAFAGFPTQEPATELLQRSLARGRLAHAYLLTGGEMEPLVRVAAALGRTLVCENPVRLDPSGPPVDACGHCGPCARAAENNHPDLYWLRPESKTRQITIEQMRDLIAAVNLKPAEARFKIATVVAADRLTAQAANAFLKTLEEPPPGSVLILLSTEPQRLLETLLSRCLRLTFAGRSQESSETRPPAWLETFAQAMAVANQGTLDRYRLLSVLLAELASLREHVEKDLASKSGLQRYEEIDPKLRERWEDELEAAVESNYREQRASLMALLQEWLHDVWVVSAQLPRALIQLHALADRSQTIGCRLSPEVCRVNLQALEYASKLLNTNVQEALVLEVAMLKLRL